MTSTAARTPAGTTVRSAERDSAPGRSTTRTILFGCGIAAGALFIVGDVLLSAMYPGYSYADRTVSELNAFGAPTRELSVALGVIHYLLLIPFGAGVWWSAGGRRSLRVAGGALAALGVSGVWGVTLGSMAAPGAEQPLSHAVSGILGLLLLATAIGFVAYASRTGFRLYSIATIIVMIAFNGWAAMEAARVAEGAVEIPWVGIKERIGFYIWHLWFIALAVALLRQPSASRADHTA